MIRSLAIGPEHGDLTVLTDAAGRGRRLAHRLTLEPEVWSVRVHFEQEEPTLGELCISTQSLRVVASGGGVTPLTSIDKGAIHHTMMSQLQAKDHAEIVYTARTIERSDAGYTLQGPLRIAGSTQPVSVEVTVEDEAEDYHLSTTCTLKQTDFGIRPYSAMLGSIRMADEVVVAWQVVVPKIEVAVAETD